MKRVAWITTVVLATIAILFLVWQFRSAVTVFLFSVAAAAIFRPPIIYLTKRGLPFKGALLLIYGYSIITIGILLVIVSLLLMSELQQVAHDFAIRYEQLVVVWPEGTPFQQAVASYLPPSATLYSYLTGGSELTTLPTMVEVTANLAEYVAYFVLVIVLSIYWTVDQRRFERLWLSLIPVEYRGPAREIGRQIEANVGAYLRSELIQSLLAGLLLWLGYWLIGLEYPTLLALIGAIAWLIPLMGILLALVPVVLLGLTSGLMWGVTAGLYTVVIFITLEYIVEPRLFDRRRFSSLLLVIIMIAFVEQIGLFGLIFAPVVTVSVQIFFNWLIQKRITLISDKPIPEIAELRKRITTVEAKLAAEKNSSSPRVDNMLQRLKELIEEASTTSTAVS